VRKTPSWPRSWANLSLLQLYSHRNAWANPHRLGQLYTFVASDLAQALAGRAGGGRATLGTTKVKFTGLTQHLHVDPAV
jgi:hypothetical protein